MPANAIQLRDVTKSYGAHKAVDTLSLTVPSGAIYGFIGPNGSGKTSTIRMILNILEPDSGSIEVLGQTKARTANDRIGYLPEERGLYKKMKVASLLEYYATIKGMPAREARLEGKRWLEKFDLAAWADKRIEALSKGMAQKVQFIATVQTRPELIILDEPFSGLDPVNLEAVRDAILELRAQGATIVFSTHDMAMAEQMCDSILMIYKGQKVLDGSLKSIKDKYGQDTIRLRTDRGADALIDLPEIEYKRDFGNYQEIRVSGDSNDLLAKLLQRARIEQFEITRPSLHDIFVRIAKPQNEDHSHE
ncbi:ABC transporter, ATP-binding protein [Verrucomicrobiia bacterium DG1235]|nr:ABC transporter, ATP-binding protein [Verrucomicrobiae bacterium DG1235]